MSDTPTCQTAGTDSACLDKSSSELLELVARFKEAQALIAKQSLTRDNALTRFCGHVDSSLVMLQTVAALIDRKATTQTMKRAAGFLIGELENLESSLSITLRVCLGELDEED
jgi:hypothetical protein